MTGTFTAKAFPADIFTGQAYEKMRAQREFREIQKDIRKKALMERSSLPPRMQKTETELKTILKKAKNDKVRKLPWPWLR